VLSVTVPCDTVTAVCGAAGRVLACAAVDGATSRPAASARAVSAPARLAVLIRDFVTKLLP